jgi:hypothetical protein
MTDDTLLNGDSTEKPCFLLELSFMRPDHFEGGLRRIETAWSLGCSGYVAASV